MCELLHTSPGATGISTRSFFAEVAAASPYSRISTATSRSSRRSFSHRADCSRRAIRWSRSTAQHGSSPDSPLEGDGFEPSVPVAREPVNIAVMNRRSSQKILRVSVVRIHLPPAASPARTRLCRAHRPAAAPADSLPFALFDAAGPLVPGRHTVPGRSTPPAAIERSDWIVIRLKLRSFNGATLI
jgi:hypothetical protein